MKVLIEDIIPTDILSRDAAIEMSFKPRPAYYARCRELNLPAPKEFYDPKIRNLFPWLARRSRAVARALNLAALLPADMERSAFLEALGFSRGKLMELVKRGYPPLISYSNPSPPLFIREKIIMDPMAGGGSIPLESVILGARTIACEYNPVAFLILRATIEWPAKFGYDLYAEVCKHAVEMIRFARDALAPFYKDKDLGYVFVRCVKEDNEVIPLVSPVSLTRDVVVYITESRLELAKGKIRGKTRRDLLPLWMEQHVRLLKGDYDLMPVHKLIAVQTQGGFRLPNESDEILLYDALVEYLKLNGAIMDIPLPSDNRVFEHILPLLNYRYLFNPRQGLAFIKLSTFLKHRISRILESDTEFGSAVATYLAFGLCRLVDFNSILTSWNHYQGTVRGSLGSYYKFREFRLDGAYAEAVVPFRTLDWIFEPNADSKTAGGICPILRELVRQLEKCDSNQIEIYMADALELSDQFDTAVDVINVDPPYFDVHSYGDLSEFFWLPLQFLLQDVLDQLFSSKILFDWSPHQRVPREHEIIARRLSDEEFSKKLARAFKQFRNVLKEDGLLIVWFSHRDIRAWQAVVSALRESKFYVTNVIPLVSEHPTRSITSGGRVGINRVLIIVARKQPQSINIEEIKHKFVEQLMKARLYPGEEVRENEVNILINVLSELFSNEGGRR